MHQAARAGVTLVGVCTGSFILSRAGLMVGRRCCVHWMHYRDFLEEFPNHHPVADQIYVVDGNRITCAGGTGVADVAAYLIERHLGRAAAQKSLHILMSKDFRRANDTQPHPPIDAPLSDSRVSRALVLMEQNISDPLPITWIASKLRLSTRQLERLFQVSLSMKPATAYRLVRLRYAKWLIENTDRSVTDIALEGGFADCAHFSRHFKTVFNLTPTESRLANASGTPPPGPSPESDNARVMEQVGVRLF